MGNFIFFTNQYLPKPGATGLCVHEIAKALAEENEVYTIAYRAKEQESLYDGVRIVPIKAPLYISKPMIKTKFKRTFLKLLSITSRCIHVAHYPLRSNDLVKKYIEGAKPLIEKWGGSDNCCLIYSIGSCSCCSKIKKNVWRFYKSCFLFIRYIIERGRQ